MSDQSTRRDFVKTASAAAAGAIIAPSLTSSAWAAGDDTIKIALVGCGGRGSGACAQALNTSGSTKLVAMADAFEDQLEKSLENLGKQTKRKPGVGADKIDVPKERRFVGLDAYKQAIDAGPDMVILATPPGFRPMQFEYAVKQGKHVFMEKPVAADAAGVRQVLAAAEEAKKKNLKVGVGLQRHHQAMYQETIAKINEGMIGDTTFLRVYWNGSTPWDPRLSRELAKSEMEYQIRNWYYYIWLSGDHINEQHIHNIDVGCWVKGGYPVKAQGQGGRQVRSDKKYGEIYDHHSVEYTFADGTVMMSHCRQTARTWASVSEYAHGTKGVATLSGGSIDDLKGANVWRYKGAKPDPYQVEHDVMQDAMRNSKDHSEAENGAKSTMAAIMGRMASYSGQYITWDQALNSKVNYTAPSPLTWNANPPTLPDKDLVYPVPMPGIYKAV